MGLTSVSRKRTFNPLTFIEGNVVLGLTFVVQFWHMEEQIIIGSSAAPVVLHTRPVNTDRRGSLSMADVPVLVTVDPIYANMHSVMADVPVLVTVDLIYANMHSIMGVSYSFHCCNCLHASLTLSLVLVAVT